MAKDLSGTVTWPAGITVPEGGDARRASTVELPFGQLADRTTFLHDRTDGSGVRRIRKVWNINAAKATTGLTYGDVVIVGGGGGGLWTGLYIFDTAVDDEAANHEPWSIAVASGGYLHLVNNSQLCDMHTGNNTEYGTEYKLVQTNENGKIAFPSVIPNRTLYRGSVVARHSYPDGGVDGAWEYSTHTSPVSTYTIMDSGVSGERMAINMPGIKPDDIVTIWASGGIGKTNSAQVGTTVYINACLYDKTTSVAHIVQEACAIIGLNTTDTRVHRWSMMGAYISPLNWGNTELQLRFKTNNDVVFYRGMSFVVDIVRP